MPTFTYKKPSSLGFKIEYFSGIWTLSGIGVTRRIMSRWLILQQPVPDDYILATGESHTVREFVERAFAHVGRRRCKIVNLTQGSLFG
jgi:hypothetical protein